MKCSVASMRRILNFATWWPKVRENAIITLWPLKWRHQVAKFKIRLTEATRNFILYHMQK